MIRLRTFVVLAAVAAVALAVAGCQVLEELEWKAEHGRGEPCGTGEDCRWELECCDDKECHECCDDIHCPEDEKCDNYICVKKNVEGPTPEGEEEPFVAPGCHEHSKCCALHPGQVWGCNRLTGECYEVACRGPDDCTICPGEWDCNDDGECVPIEESEEEPPAAAPEKDPTPTPAPPAPAPEPPGERQTPEEFMGNTNGWFQDRNIDALLGSLFPDVHNLELCRAVLADVLQNPPSYEYVSHTREDWTLYWTRFEDVAAVRVITTVDDQTFEEVIHLKWENGRWWWFLGDCYELVFVDPIGDAANCADAHPADGAPTPDVITVTVRTDEIFVDFAEPLPQTDAQFVAFGVSFNILDGPQPDPNHGWYGQDNANMGVNMYVGNEVWGSVAYLGSDGEFYELEGLTPEASVSEDGRSATLELPAYDEVFRLLPANSGYPPATGKVRTFVSATDLSQDEGSIAQWNCDFAGPPLLFFNTWWPGP